MKYPAATVGNWNEMGVGEHWPQHEIAGEAKNIDTSKMNPVPTCVCHFAAPQNGRHSDGAFLCPPISMAQSCRSPMLNGPHGVERDKGCQLLKRDNCNMGKRENQTDPIPLPSD